MQVSTARAGPRGGAAASSGRGLPVLSVPPRRPGGGRARYSPSRVVSLLFCALFALIGLVPLLAGVLLRTDRVRELAAEETSRVLERELGLVARFRVEVQPWPLGLLIDELEVDGSDGLGPVLTVERISVAPRVFSLLGGRLDVGAIEVIGPRARLVVRDGELTNLHLDLPESEGESEPIDRLPLTALAITDLSLDLDLDSTLLRLSEVDADLVTEADGGLELVFGAGSGTLTRAHADPAHANEDAVDEDRLCRFDARMRVDLADRSVLVRRLAFAAVTDFDPDPGTRPGCDLVDTDWRRLDLTMDSLTLRAPADGESLPRYDGKVGVRLPAGLVHRFLDFSPATGSIELDAEIRSREGSPLPQAAGRLQVRTLGLDGKLFAEYFDGRVSFDEGVVRATNVRALWGDGEARIADVELSPFEKGMPLRATDIAIDGVDLQGILRDVGVHPQSHVGWKLERTTLPHFGGTLSPLALEGPITSNTRDFGVYDRPAQLSDRKRMISVERGRVEGTFAVTPEAVVLRRMHLQTNQADLVATVKLGFSGGFGLDVFEGSRLDLAELSPIVSVPIGGEVRITAHSASTLDVPIIEGNLSVQRFMLGGLEIGDVRSARAHFLPLKLSLSGVELAKNGSVLSSQRATVDFDAGADVVVDAEVDTRRAPHLSLRDFFEVFELDEDPRFADFESLASGTAQVRYVLGGREDRCGGGFLDVRTKMRLVAPKLFGESFEDGALDLRFVWEDQEAGDEGMKIDVASASLRDGQGSIVARADVGLGGTLRGDVVATGLELSRLESLGLVRRFVDGEAQAIGRLSGTVSRPALSLDVGLGPLRLGANKLGASRFALLMEPEASPPRRAQATTGCKRLKALPFDRAVWERDESGGRFVLDGQLFDGQLRLEDFAVTQQRDQRISGRVLLSGLDLGVLVGAVPALAYSGGRIAGSVSADVRIEELRPSRLGETRATAELFDLELRQDGRRIELDEASGPLAIAGDTLVVPPFVLGLTDRSGLRVALAGSASIEALTRSPVVDARLSIAPLELSKLASSLPGVTRLEGLLSGSIALKGPLATAQTTGEVKLRRGALGLSGLPIGMDEIEVDVAIGAGELRLVRGTAKVGAGTIDVTGRAPLPGIAIGPATANITARGIRVPLDEGIELVTDADLTASFNPGPRSSDNLPEVRGDVRISSFTYRRPISLSLDLGELSKRIRRTEVKTFDPDGDVLRFDLSVRSTRSIVVDNDLFDMRLEVVEPGLQLSGTNQRFGARGALRILPESKMRLRNHEFDVREGSVRFVDPAKLRPELDVRATTEFRRYSSSSSDADASSTSASSSTTGGNWDISVRAHGSSEDLRLDLTSDPPLDQEDIVLLLTVGMTRAEIDRGLASSIGETVGLEALSSLTGADKAVKSVVPIIDYFHFGSGYSARTGRTEPNVTVGKRLTNDVRASVTTTLTERDVGATLEWRLKRGVSVQASYDNTNDIGTIIGNLGADLRWRLEFE